MGSERRGKTIIAAAREGGHRKLPLVAAQSELVAPKRNFEAEALVS